MNSNSSKPSNEMEAIWLQIPKEKDLPPGLPKGEYIRYFAVDPKYLYQTGFVDENKYTLEEWEVAFNDCKQEDGTYIISKEKFLSLAKYKYNGPIYKPLDLTQIREGWYDLKIWRDFCLNSILPCTTLTLEKFLETEKTGEEIFKKKGLIKNDQIYVDKNYKLQLQQFLNSCPSIRRTRELAIEEGYQNFVKSEASASTKPIVENRYVSGRKVGEKEKKKLGETLLKSSVLKKSDSPAPETVSLKDLRKKSKSTTKNA